MEADNFFYYLRFDRFHPDESGKCILAGYFLERSKDSEDLALTVVLDLMNSTARLTGPSRKLVHDFCPESFQKMITDSFADPDNPLFSRAREWLNTHNGDRPAK